MNAAQLRGSTIDPANPSLLRVGIAQAATADPIIAGLMATSSRRGALIYANALNADLVI